MSERLAIPVLFMACVLAMLLARIEQDLDRQSIAATVAALPDVPAIPRPREVGQFVVCPDARSRSCTFAYEHLTYDVVNRGQAERSGSFKGDETIPHDWRATDSDYAGNGFDEGHMAPFGDFGHQAAADATFILTNAVPQDPQLNRNLWRTIEAHVRGIVDKTHDVYVITLPLYLPDAKGVIHISTIGKHRVWVPTDVAKAVLVLKNGQPQTMLGWIVPNVPPVEDDADKYRVPVSQIEFDAGLDFFAWLDDDLEKKLESAEP